MASTTTNGVVLQVPYAVIRNPERTRPFTASIIGPDPLRGGQNTLRAFPTGPITPSNLVTQYFTYVGDKITWTLQAPCVDPSAKAFEFGRVSFTTGVVTLDSIVSFTAAWQRQLVVTVTAINATSGAVTYTVAYS